MKRRISIALALIMILGILAGCGGSQTPAPAEEPAPAAEEPAPAAEPAAEAAEPAATRKVGISMPTQSLQRWNQDGANMKAQFEAAGFEVDLQYAGDNEIPMQVSQLENMISGGCEVLVIAAIDGSALTQVLKEAKDKGISVIAYDRLIMDSDAVSYYATFDNFKVGTIQGEYIVDALDLDGTDGPYNIEFFTGDPGDNNIHFFYGGALSVLQPYIDSGKLVVPSGQIETAQVATKDWNPENAQRRMEDLISAQGYSPTGTKLDAVCCSNDSTANGVTNALLGAGFTAENFPIITGQDCDKTAMKNIIAGTQSMSIFKDTRTLAERVVKMVTSIMNGEEVEVNDTETYDNGTGVIPSFLCDPVIGTKDNYKELLIDSGYYTEADLQ